MKTMKWLIKREMWENKGMLLWTPIVIAGAVVTLILTGLIFGNLDTIRLYNQPLSVTIEGTARTRIVETMGEMYVTAGMPILMILGLLVFFYCLGALHDERRDRSLLFWKSLPVSDSMTVLSKLVTALVVAPLITLGVAIAVGLLMVLALCGLAAMHGTNLFGALLMTPQFYLTPLRLVALLPVYILWALPTVGWLLMVSSIARSKVFLCGRSARRSSPRCCWCGRKKHCTSGLMRSGSPATSPAVSCWAWCRVRGSGSTSRR